MARINEIKSIMRQLKDSKTFNESLINEAEESDTTTENDACESDLVIARLEDILSRFEKVIAAAEGDTDDETPAEDEESEEEPAEEEESEEEPVEDEASEEEPAEDETAEESYTRSLERRIRDLERRYTESRRRSACRRFTR